MSTRYHTTVQEEISIIPDLCFTFDPEVSVNTCPYFYTNICLSEYMYRHHSALVPEIQEDTEYPEPSVSSESSNMGARNQTWLPYRSSALHSHCYCNNHSLLYVSGFFFFFKLNTTFKLASDFFKQKKTRKQPNQTKNIQVRQVFITSL